MKKIIKIISNNKIIILPTNTIYGLSGNKQNKKIIYKILFIKKRKFKLLMSLITNSINKIFLWIEHFSIKTKNLTKKIQKNTTIIFIKYNIKKNLKKTIAIRIPKSKKIKNLIKPFSGVISTSINENNKLHIINYNIIKNFLTIKIDFGIKKNKYLKGIESTIISSIKKKIIRKNNKKNILKKYKKTKKIKKKYFYEIYNRIFYENLLNNSINIIYLTKIHTNFAKKNMKNEKKQKNLIKNINIIDKNYGNEIILQL